MLLPLPSRHLDSEMGLKTKQNKKTGIHLKRPAQCSVTVEQPVWCPVLWMALTQTEEGGYIQEAKGPARQDCRGHGRSGGTPVQPAPELPSVLSLGRRGGDGLPSRDLLHLVASRKLTVPKHTRG